jgi:hypothetical protein
MTNNTSAGMNQFLTGSNPTDGTERQAGWLRGVVVVGVMTLLVLGMNPDGGRHIPVSALETNAKLILAVGGTAFRGDPLPQLLLWCPPPFSFSHPSGLGYTPPSSRLKRSRPTVD